VLAGGPTGTEHPASTSRAFDDPFVVGGAGPEADLPRIEVAGMTLGDLEWIVPGVVLTVPGLLILLAVVAQLAGGTLWLPLARRVLGSRRRGSKNADLAGPR
jgi:hypothetical protein